MSDDFSFKLCKLVQGHPELYDIFNGNFHNEDAKNNAWKLISTELGVPQSKCVIKWKSLKHQFVKAKKDQNTTWDLWPTLQFLDEAGDKAGSRKRKRESTAGPTRLDNADRIDSTASKSPENPPAKKVATRAKQSVRNSPQDTTGLTGTTVTNSSPQNFLSEIPYSFWSISPVKGDSSIVASAANESSKTPSSRLSQTTATPKKSIVKLQPEPAQPTASNNAARRRSQRFGRDESAAETLAASKTVTFSQVIKQETPKKQTTEPLASVPTASLVSKPQTPVARATPRGRRSTRVTVAETIPEEKEGATAVAPSRSHGKEPEAELPSLETPKKVTAEPVALAPTSSPVSNPQPTARATPRGRRSTRVTIAATAPEETQEAAAAAPSRSPGKEPKAKQPRIEGNGVVGEVDDPLTDMKFGSTLDQKFFKQLQEKFAKLSPEVVSTMKANIFAMLDNAARA